MTSEATQIKNLIISHLRGATFGMEIYGQHEIKVFDRVDGVCVIEVNGPQRWERYGQVIVYHPRLGKWAATLLSEHHCGKPVQAFTAEEIRAMTTRSPMVVKVFGCALDTTPVVWDAYWEAAQ